MNRFDEGLAGCDLSGNIFKSIGKSVKKAVKSVRKVTSKIAHKVLPKKVREIGKKLDKLGITKLAAGAALMIVNPLAGSKLIGLAGKVAGKSLIEDGKKQIVTVKAVESAERHAKEVGAGIGEAVRELPEFQSVVSQLRSEGYTDDQILMHWAESKQYYLEASRAAAATVLPAVEGAVRNMGVPSNQVESVAASISSEIGGNIAKDVQNKVTGASDLKPLLLGAISLFMLSKGG